jgi:hypothetical protein
MRASHDRASVDEWINTNRQPLSIESSRNLQVNRRWMYKIMSLIIGIAIGGYLFLR